MAAISQDGALEGGRDRERAEEKRTKGVKEGYFFAKHEMRVVSGCLLVTCCGNTLSFFIRFVQALREQTQRSSPG